MGEGGISGRLKSEKRRRKNIQKKNSHALKMGATHTICQVSKKCQNDTAELNIRCVK